MKTMIMCKKDDNFIELNLHYNIVKSGVEATFIPIDEFEGLKLYAKESCAVMARDYQLEAFGCEVGPEVLSDIVKIEFPMNYIMSTCGVHYAIKTYFKFASYCAWGYHTQLADTQKVERKHDNHECLMKYMDDENTMLEKCRELSYIPKDVHENNVGYIGDTLVLIDFGYASTWSRNLRKNT